MRSTSYNKIAYLLFILARVIANSFLNFNWSGNFLLACIRYTKPLLTEVAECFLKEYLQYFYDIFYRTFKLKINLKLK